MKKILLRLCVIMSLFTICMFGSTTSNATSNMMQQQQKPNFDKETVGKYAQSLFNQWAQLNLTYMGDPERAEIYKSRMDAEQFELQKAWYDLIDQAGKVKKIKSCNVEFNENKTIATATIIANCSKKDIRFITKFDKEFVNTNPEVTINGGDKPSVSKALMNTLMGMGTVFVVLIFISFIIALFKFIPSLFNGSKDKAKTAVVAEVKEEPVIEEEEEELVDDGELVAVITAAIMASMGDAAPADGLVVRSIRKVNKSKWRNA